MNNLLDNYVLKFDEEFKKGLELIKKYDKIAIFRHRIPDFDALGSQLGFYHFLKENFPEKEIHVLGDDHNKFTPRLYQEMDVLDDTWFDEPFLAIIVDVSDPDRVADERVLKAADKFILDHHPSKEKFADIHIVDSNLAAAAELVFAFIYWSKLPYSTNSAKELYSALVGDSGRFLYLSTSSMTFNIASLLISTGININEIYTKMYESELKDLEIQRFILSHYKLSKNGVAYYILREKDLKKLKLSQLNAKAYVNMFSNINEIGIWCSISEDTKDKCWRISIRSKKVDISGVARKYRGGGHAQASGSRLESLKELRQFIADLDELLDK